MIPLIECKSIVLNKLASLCKSVVFVGERAFTD